ncbi:MAG: ATP-dependent DNA helicase PcrA, partial [Ruminococcaceae bacterium]|nr:ATP-dependent DNA helicase PcrA [Oscillospiraceae bacterium]
MNYSHLNEMQQRAVEQTEGPLLILAGAGSGKTTVLVNRIAHIIEDLGTAPWSVLAITFTNKAAGELKGRLEQMLGDCANDIWAGTFHSCCMRILRRDIEKLGYDSSFNVYDSADQQTLMKECLSQLNLDDKAFPVKTMLSYISSAKDSLIDCDAYTKKYEADFRMSKVAALYTLYQQKLRAYNAVDFDDIILLTVKLFRQYPEVLEYYANKFRYILVDEYQDTNHCQFELVRLLSSKHHNLCVVGDDDQSIYKFRGANIQNILDFERCFDNAIVIKLEQNYRCPAKVLEAANCVIANNTQRKEKRLWTENEDGELPFVFDAQNEHDEAYFIADKISALVRREGASYSDFAILYRMNAQSRVLENVLNQNGIPHRVLGGMRFYDRMEVKDIIAYLRLVQNPGDNISLKRIINKPKRGIGQKSIDTLEEIALTRGISMFEATGCANEIPELSRAAAKMIMFHDLIYGFFKYREEIAILIDSILRESGYMDELLREDTPEARSRIENIKELTGAINEYTEQAEEPTLAGYLEQVSLVSDIDNYDQSEDAVVLMTLHSVKGLEFPNVFLCGMEEGVFPGYRSITEEDELEEERRLCYVGITRAMKRLFMTHAFSRTLF